MSRIVRMTSETPVDPDTIEGLTRLAERPDSEIDTSDIPERTPEQFAAAKVRRDERWKREAQANLQKKAS